MYKDFNVVIAVFIIILTLILFVWIERVQSYELVVFVNTMCLFMLWLDGRISALIDEIRDKRDK